MINTLLVLLATLMLYDLGRKKKLPLPWFLPLLFNLLIRNSLVSMGGSMTREYTAIFLLLFFCIMLGRLRYKYILLGILGGLTGWMQQDAMITLLPLLLYALLAGDEQPAQPRSKKFLLLTAGFMLVSLPVLFFFLFHGALSYLWKDAFLFNLLLPQQQMNLIREIKIIKHALHECEYEMTFYTAAILGLISPFIAHKKGKLLYAAVLTLLLSFVAELLTGRLILGPGFYYYFLPLSASIPIVVFVVFAYSNIGFLKERNIQLIFGLILCITQFLGALRYASGLGNTSNGVSSAIDKLPEMIYLKKQNLSDYQLFVFDDSNLIYFYNTFRILAPSPWIYHYFYSWYPDWEGNRARTNALLEDLQYHKTKFILDCSDAKGDLRSLPVYSEWKRFLQKHYQPVLTDSSKRILWRLQ